MSNYSKFRKELFKIIKEIHKKTGYLSFVILLDILWCYIRYGSTYKEYNYYEFYKLDSSLKATYVTKKKIKKINKKLVDNAISNVITDKKIFLLRFKKYINKSIINLNDFSYKEFENYVYSSKSIIARSINTSFIKSYKEFNTSDYRSPAYLEKELKEKKLLILENKININSELKKISDIVLINMVSVYNTRCNIITSSIKYKDNNNKIITGYVDIKKGIIIGRLKDENNQNCGSLDGFKIPCYEKILKLCEELSHELEEIKQVEWSFIVDNKENVYLVDANIFNDYLFAQSPDYLKYKMGLMKYYSKFL